MKDYEEIVDNGLWPTWPKRYDDKTPLREDEIGTCTQWIRKFAIQCEMFDKKSNSYYLKHLVEDWTRTLGDVEQVDRQGRVWVGHKYVSNGAFIEAARREGYKIKRVEEGNPNAVFNMKLVTAN